IRDDLVTGVQTCALPIYRAETGGSFGQQGGKPANLAGLPMVLLSCVEASVGNGSRRFWRRERNFRSNAGLAHKLTPWQKQSCEHARAGDGETLASNTRIDRKPA